MVRARFFRVGVHFLIGQPERASAQSEAQQLKERDLARIQQRCDDLREQSTKFELAYNHATENLAQVTHDSERLRTECATLRAEKLIWKVLLMMRGDYTAN